MAALIADLVFVTTAADERGLAYVVWAHNRSFDHLPHLTVLDFDSSQPLVPPVFKVLRDRLNDAFDQLTCQRPPQLWARRTIAELAKKANEAWIDEITTPFWRGDVVAARRAELAAEYHEVDEVLKDRDLMLLTANAAHSSGRVLLSESARVRAQSLPVPFFSYEPNLKSGALCDAWLLGVAIADLGPERVRPARAKRSKNANSGR